MNNLMNHFASKKSEELDWANLSKYHEENQKLMVSKKNLNRIVFIGDSITEGWYDSDPDFFLKNNFINRGISGQTTHHMLVRFRPDAIKLNPKMIIINAGTNDIAGNTGPLTSEMIIDNIYSMVDIAIRNNIDVSLSSILPVYKYPWNENVKNPPKIISFINSNLKKFCKDNGLIYIDYYSSMVDKKKGLKSIYGYDGVHPTRSGYKVMQKIIKTLIPGIK